MSNPEPGILVIDGPDYLKMSRQDLDKYSHIIIDNIPRRYEGL